MIFLKARTSGEAVTGGKKMSRVELGTLTHSAKGGRENNSFEGNLFFKV